MSQKRFFTIGLTPHRLEFLPAMTALMAQHKSIVLEEPPHEGLNSFLKGRVSIEEILEDLEAGFPEYTKAAYRHLKVFHDQGLRICQVEPYLEGVFVIHKLIEEEGCSPQDISRLPFLAEVYKYEHQATGALLDFYAAMGAPFEEVLSKLKAFAQADAQRLDFRDQLRARAIRKLLSHLPMPIFIEAGYIHLRLIYYLARNKGAWRLCVRNLLLEATRAHGLSSFWPSPGDGLTSYYLLGKRHRHVSEDLLAARSLVYIKLIEKEEMFPSAQKKFPHLYHELIWRIFANFLSYEDCKRLDRFIRLLPTNEARSLAQKLFPHQVQQAQKKVEEAFQANALRAK